MTGLTSSLNFPTTAGAHDTTFNGGASVLTDGYYTKLSPTGDLLYSTYFGGTDEEISSGLAVDAANNVYIVGQTTSNTAEGFSTPNGLRTLFGSIRDGFLLKFNSSGVLTYGTYIGGPNGQNFAYDVAGGLLYGTYYGGTNNESFYGVTVDASGRIYACGYTQSSGLVTAMAAGGAVPSGTRRDALVAKFDTSLSGAPSKVYAIRVAAVDASLGGEHANDIAVDALGRAWVVGLHNGSTLNLINPFDSQDANLRAFVAQIAADGASALLVSYAGGRNTNNTNLLGVALNTAGEVYMAGFTVEPSITSASLPLVSPFQAVYGGGGSDGTLQKLGFSIDLSLTKTASAGVVLPGQPVTFTLTVRNPSSDSASGVVVTDNLPVGLQFVSCSSTPPGICAGTGNARTVSFASLAPAATATIQIVATMVAVTPGQQILNSAEVVAGVLDPVPANNIGTAMVSVPTLEPTGDADGDGKTNVQEQQEGTHPRGFVITYLAEGATGAFFDTRLAIANPSTSAALVLTRFQRADGTTIRDYRVVAPLSRATIDAEAIAGLEAAEFSTLVEADVQVTVTYLLPAPALPLVKSYVVNPRSRFNIWVDNEGLTDPAYAALANAELSAIIESTNGVPIIAERAMYLDQPGRPLGAGHESAGVTSPATEWFLAEGATGSYFDLFILIANPGNTAATVQADYLLAGGQVLTKAYTVPANSRFNIWVDLEDVALANAALSTRITSTNDVPIIVERSMWWPGPTSNTWQEAHNSPGETTTGTRWAMAEGEVGGPRETETCVLVANTSALAGTIRATVLFEDGSAPVSREFGIGARTRMNIAPFDDFPATRGKRFGMVVESIGGAPVGVRWAAGTNALATRLP